MESIPSVAQASTDRIRAAPSPRRLLRWALAGVLGLLATLALIIVLLDRAASARETESQDASAPAGGRLLDAMPLDPTFGRVFVQEWGPPDATPVIISPGAGAWSGFWAETAQVLAAAGYRVVAVDLPPFGYSDRDASLRYGRADQAARLIGVLDAIDACRGVLIGHSFGSGPVVEALLRYPQRLQGAVLIAPALGLPADAEAPAEPSALMRAILSSPRATRIYTAATLTNPWLTQRALSSMLARKDAATTERADILQRPQRRTGSTDAYAAWLPFLLRPDADALSRNADGYRSISRPVAMVWGDADSVVPVAQGQRLAQLIPGATLDTLPGVGHIPHIEAPQDTVAALRRQLERISPTATQRNAPHRLDQERCKLGGTL